MQNDECPMTNVECQMTNEEFWRCLRPAFFAVRGTLLQPLTRPEPELLYTPLKVAFSGLDRYEFGQVVGRASAADHFALEQAGVFAN